MGQPLRRLGRRPQSALRAGLGPFAAPFDLLSSSSDKAFFGSFSFFLSRCCSFGHSSEHLVGLGTPTAMASTARAFGAMLHKVPRSNGLFSSLASLHNPSSLLSTILLESYRIYRHFQIARIRIKKWYDFVLSWIGFLGRISASFMSNELGLAQRVRRISTTPPVCMGRRSCKIAGRKVRSFKFNFLLYFRINSASREETFSLKSEMRCFFGEII